MLLKQHQLLAIDCNGRYLLKLLYYFKMLVELSDIPNRSPQKSKYFFGNIMDHRKRNLYFLSKNLAFFLWRSWMLHHYAITQSVTTKD